MPSTAAIVWSIIAGAFATLLLIVGWLLSRASKSIETGIDGLRTEVQGLRVDIGKYHDSEMETRGDLKAFQSRCEERHQRLDYEIASMKQDRRTK